MPTFRWQYMLRIYSVVDQSDDDMNERSNERSEWSSEYALIDFGKNVEFSWFVTSCSTPNSKHNHLLCSRCLYSVFIRRKKKLFNTIWWERFFFFLLFGGIVRSHIAICQVIYDLMKFKTASQARVTATLATQLSWPADHILITNEILWMASAAEWDQFERISYFWLCKNDFTRNRNSSHSRPSMGMDELEHDWH